VAGLRPNEFKTEVEDRLQFRYDWVAAVASATSLFTMMTLLFIVGAARSRLRMKRRLREMEQEKSQFGLELDP